MEWALAIVALAVLAVAAISRHLTGGPLTPAMLFVFVGLLVGPRAIDGLDLSSTSSTVRALAEATLTLVLFADASRIDPRQLRSQASVPLRQLGIGLPLPIALGALACTPWDSSVGFGPRGLASIVFAVIVIEESRLPQEHEIVLAIYLTVGLSVLAHGLSAAPLAKRYGRWYAAHPRDRVPSMESEPAEETRVKGPIPPEVFAFSRAGCRYRSGVWGR